MTKAAFSEITKIQSSLHNGFNLIMIEGGLEKQKKHPGKSPLQGVRGVTRKARKAAAKEEQIVRNYHE